jgi:hypothetical protein
MALPRLAAEVMFFQKSLLYNGDLLLPAGKSPCKTAQIETTVF